MGQSTRRSKARRPAPMGRSKRREGGDGSGAAVLRRDVASDLGAELLANFSLTTRTGGFALARIPKRRKKRLGGNQAIQRKRHPSTGPKWRLLREKWVILKDGDKHCYSCNDWFTFYEQVLHQVIVGPGEFLSIYTCTKCNEGKRTMNWETVFAEPEEDDGSDIPF